MRGDASLGACNPFHSNKDRSCAQMIFLMDGIVSESAAGAGKEALICSIMEISITSHGFKRKRNRAWQSGGTIEAKRIWWISMWLLLP
jgi:hypothetical protein